RSAPGRQTGSGWNAFSTFRSKPQIKAQATYYLPGKAGSHDFKFGFEDIYDSYHFGINGQSGPYRLSYATPTSPTADRIRFIDTGLPGDYNNCCTAGANLVRHSSLYAENGWALSQPPSPTSVLLFVYHVACDNA